MKGGTDRMFCTYFVLSNLFVLVLESVGAFAANSTHKAYARCLDVSMNRSSPENCSRDSLLMQCSNTCLLITRSSSCVCCCACERSTTERKQARSVRWDVRCKETALKWAAAAEKGNIHGEEGREKHKKAHALSSLKQMDRNKRVRL